MEMIQDRAFDEERALYGRRDILVKHCAFDGPADGESALKECADVRVEDSFFNLRYPFWHDHNLTINGSELTEQCRAALWYADHVKIADTRLHGIKALRECSEIQLDRCDIISPEFGWSARQVDMEDCTAQSEYFLLRASGLHLRGLQMTGKYSFQYIENAVLEHCTLDTKDAFWHARDVVVRDSVVKGEYLGWYSENVTFERCRIIGTQPLCYCKGLKLVDCEMVDTDLAFERSEVEAAVTTPMLSIKNPLSGRIIVPAVGEIIRDIPEAKGEIVVRRPSGAPYTPVCA